MYSIIVVALFGVSIWCELCNAYEQQFMYPTQNYIEDQEYWRRLGRDEIRASFDRPVNWNIAKNVIIMVGDGMDPNTVTASRIYKEREEGKLTFEWFPHLALLKTYSIDKKVPDAAATGTALFTGVKTRNEIIGLDSRVRKNDCMGSLSASARVSSIMQWAQDAGKHTGFVTNKRVTDAIPSALYAHSASRYWECDTLIPPGSMCRDIARQLIEEEPGRNFKVIFGGGRQCLMANAMGLPGDRLDQFACLREDDKNLLQEWLLEKRQKNANSVIAKNTRELLEIDTQKTEYALGLFSNSHFPFEADRDTSGTGQPSLKIMVEPAIKILKKNRNGFVLMVHGGLIDKAHHEGNARKAIEETLEFEKAVQKVRELLYEMGIQNETLLIVTGGHGHTMSINGYPDRNATILGIAEKSKHDAVAYTTLTYATGSNMNYQYGLRDNFVYRDDPSKSDTTGREYHQLAAILTDKETHGGGDVTVYATGPMAHLFHSVHEQTYVAYVIAYAAKIGPFGVNSALTCSPTLFLCLSSIFVIFFDRKSI